MWTCILKLILASEEKLETVTTFEPEQRNLFTMKLMYKSMQWKSVFVFPEKEKEIIVALVVTLNLNLKRKFQNYFEEKKIFFLISHKDESLKLGWFGCCNN